MTQVPLITFEQIAATYPNESTETCNSILTRCNNAISEYNKVNAEQEQPLISAEEARKLGAGKAEFLGKFSGNWIVCEEFCSYSSDYKYRAIKQPEPATIGMRDTAYKDSTPKPTCQIKNLDTGVTETMTRVDVINLLKELGVING